MADITLSDISNAMGFNEKEPAKDFSYYGTIVSEDVENDTYQVSINRDPSTTVTASRMAGAKVGDVVIVTVMANGHASVTSCKGGDRDALKAIADAEAAGAKADTAARKADAIVSDVEAANERIDGISEDYSILDQDYRQYKIDTNNAIGNVQTRVTNAENALGKKVNVSEYNNQIQSINQNISAMGQTITDQDGRISSAESSIIQNADAIETKVTASVEGAADMVSYINQTASSIKIKAEHIVIDGDLIVGKDYVDGAVDDIEIGGRNLVLGTGTPFTRSAGAVSAGGYIAFDLYNLVGAYNTLGLTTDDYLTVSFDISVTGAVANTTLKVGTNVSPWEYFGVVHTFGAGASSAHIEKTFKVTSALISSTGSKFRFRVDCPTAATAFGCIVNNVKLEKGNKATSWTPAPEDSKTYTDNAVNDLEIGGRNLLYLTPMIENKTVYNCYRLALTENLVKGQKYTIQFWGMTLDSGSQGFGVYWGGGNVRLDPSNSYQKPTDGYWEYTFTAPNSTHTDTNNKFLNVYNFLSGHSGSNCSIDKWKIEKGDKATDYSISPEDAQLSDGFNLIVNAKTPRIKTITPPYVAVSSGGDGRGALTYTSGLTAFPHTHQDIYNVIYGIYDNTTGNRDFQQVIPDFTSLWTEGKWKFSAYVKAKADTVTALIRVWGANQNFSYTQSIGTTWTKIEVPILLSGTKGSNPHKICFGMSGAGSIEYFDPRVTRVTPDKSFYCTCDTAAATVDKVVSAAKDFALTAGTYLNVRFTYGNTASTMNLNVNSLGSKPVSANYSYTTTGVLNLPAQATATFMYTGTEWRFISTDNVTNMLKFTATDGLKIMNVGDQTDYVQIQSQEIKICTDGDQVASFSDDIILGKWQNLIISTNERKKDASIKLTTPYSTGSFVQLSCSPAVLSGEVYSVLWLHDNGGHVEITGGWLNCSVETPDDTDVPHKFINVDAINGLEVVQNAGILCNQMDKKYVVRPYKTSSIALCSALGNGSYPTRIYGTKILKGNGTAEFATSDERIKKDFTSIDNAKDFLMDINTFSFKWDSDSELWEEEGTNDGKRNFGVSAQQVLKTLEEHNIDPDEYSLVSSDEHRYYVSYEQFIPLLIRTVQDQQKEIDELKHTIKTVKMEVN